MMELIKRGKPMNKRNGNKQKQIREIGQAITRIADNLNRLKRVRGINRFIL